jgi:hypothetical protein
LCQWDAVGVDGALRRLCQDMFLGSGGRTRG